MLGKVVSQTSPVEVQKSIRFVGDANGVTAMATDGIEVISLVIEATTEHEIDTTLRHVPEVVAEMRALSPFVKH